MPTSNNYKKTFLNQVIFRVDFIEFIDNEAFSQEVLSPIADELPNKGMTQALQIDAESIQMNQNGSVRSESKHLNGQIILLRSSNSDISNSVKISNSFFVADFQKYTTFSEAYKIIKLTLDTYFDIKKVTSKRIGLRYINLYPTTGIRLNQSLFNGKVKHSISTPLPNSMYADMLVDSMCKDKYRIDDAYLNVRYGWLKNPLNIQTFPQQFTLDFDCYTEDALNSSTDIIEFLNNSHRHITTMFEETITEKMRGIMSER